MRHLFIFVFLVSLAGSAVIQDFVLMSEGNNTKFIIKGDAPFAANTFTLKDPSRLVVDCSGVSSAFIGKKFDLNRGGVEELSFTSFSEQPDLLRIVGKLNRDYSFLTSVEGNNFVVTLLTELTASFPEWQALTGQSIATKQFEEPKLPVVPTPRPTTTVTGRPISCDFENADILTVLRALSEYAGVNIVAGPSVKGTVTVRLHNVPWRQAFEIILRAAGYAYREDPGVIRVDTGENLDKQDYDLPLLSKVYKLEFASPDGLVDKIRAMLSPKGKVNVDTRTYSLVVTEVEPIHAKVEQLIKILDTPTPQVEIMAKVVELGAAR